MKGELAHLLGELKAGLAALYGPRLRGVYLFGSRARGDHRPDSDVDVLIVLDRVESVWEESERTSFLNAGLSLDYEVNIGFVFVSRSDWRTRDSMFLKNVREDAIPA